MLNFLTSLVRTGVPIYWGALVAWLAGIGLPAEVVATVADPQWSGALVFGAVATISTAVYAVARVVELHLPRLLSAVHVPADVVKSVTGLVVALLLGVPRPPDYTPGESGTR